MKTEILIAIISAATAILGTIIGYMASWFATKSTLKIEIKKIKIELLRDKQKRLDRLSKKMFQMIPAGSDPLVATVDNFMMQASEFEMCEYLFSKDLADQVSGAKSKLGKLITEAKTKSAHQKHLNQNDFQELSDLQINIKAATKQAMRETQQSIDRLTK